MTTAVVGAGGLLGGAVVQEARRRGETVVPVSVPWHDAEASVAALTEAFSALVERSRRTGRPWRLAWCAGAGVVATAQEVLDVEVSIFRATLERWAGVLDDGHPAGSMFLASSAGGVYAGSADPPFTEETPPCPLRPYGHAKLAMEAAACAFGRRTRTPVLIGRISNLYGPGQDLTKGQGLISAIAKAYVTGEPVPVFVPLSTTRDYLYVQDCARMVVAGLDEVAGPEPAVKVLAGRQGGGHSIAELFEVATRLYGEPPPHIVGDPARGAGQVADLRFISRVWPELDALGRTDLAAGLDATMRDVRARFGADTNDDTKDGDAG